MRKGEIGMRNAEVGKRNGEDEIGGWDDVDNNCHLKCEKVCDRKSGGRLWCWRILDNL